MKRILEDITVPIGPLRPRLLGEAPFVPVLEITPLRFPFHLCRKQTVLGELSLDHWWMDTGSLYGQRNRRAVNFEPVVEHWWAVCKQHLTVLHESIQESYILANLVPYARANGSRRVFADAVPTYGKHGRERLHEEVKSLNDLLAASSLEPTDVVGFRDRTGDLLGPPRYADQVHEEYRQVAEQLLGEGRAALQRDGRRGLQVALDRWEQWMKSIGRHRGNEAKKQLLDILSYECRAALHRCYSQVWCDLLPHLRRKYEFSEESFRFHCLWHLDHCQESDQPESAYFHLFHGHIFALHPASGLFIQTKTGSDLIGRWVQDPEDETTRGRLLHGLTIAVAHYDERKDTAALLRKKEAGSESIGNLPAFEEQSVARRSGRRLLQKRKTDAR